jgi:hypothetical protein
MKAVAELMVLCKARDRAGRKDTSRHPGETALRPNILEVKPLTLVRNSEHDLRRWIRGEPGPHIGKAIAELIVGELMRRLCKKDVVPTSEFTCPSANSRRPAR